MFPGIPLYICLVAVAIIDCIWIAVTGIKINPSSILPGAFSVAQIFCLTMGARFVKREILPFLQVRHQSYVRVVFEKLVLILDNMFFTAAMLIVLPLYGSLTMDTHISYADAWLNDADHFLHLDWLAYLSFVEQNPLVKWLYDYAYYLLGTVSFVGLLGVLIFGSARRGEFYNAAFFVSATICITVGMSFPAKGPVSILSGGHMPFRNTLGVIPGMEHVSYLDRLRNDLSFSLDLTHLPGLVTFPSFHTAAAIVLVWCLYRTYLFWPAFLYMVVMIASTPIFGGHYFVDIISGAVAAVASVLMLRMMPRYRGVLGPPAARANQATERVITKES